MQHHRDYVSRNKENNNNNNNNSKKIAKAKALVKKSAIMVENAEKDELYDEAADAALAEAEDLLTELETASSSSLRK